MNSLPILNWVSKHDERSKAYPIRTLVHDIKIKTRVWTPGEILDQGREGMCVGFGWTAEALCTPVRVDLSRIKASVPTEPNIFASFIYNKAKVLDNWYGENYEGTSVIAGAKAMQSINLLKEYRWAFSIEDVIQAIIKTGPVVLGINWLHSMYEAPNGVLIPSGKVVGGHCILAIGFYTSSLLLNGEPGILLQNSWGNTWGNNGKAIIRVTDLELLLANYGEACVPFKRSYGRG